ncbi:MAG: ABC-2 transporter permease [Oscillospiraceae bacterium]|nr:ABC-2 transporter permease [Oscillospiraceae bacterium]
MRGLIWRQWYLSKNYILTGAAVMAGFWIIELLVFLSLQSGNLSRMEDPDSIRESVAFFSVLLKTVLPYGILCSDQVTEADYKAHWHLYSYTLPVSEKRLAAVKFIWFLLCFAVTALLSTGSSLLVLSRTDLLEEDMSVGIVLGMQLVYAAFFWLTSCMTIPLTVRLKKTGLAVMLSMGVFILAMGVVMSVFTAKMAQFINDYVANIDPAETDGDKITGELIHKLTGLFSGTAVVIVLVMLIALVLAYLATVHALKRRTV